MCRLTIGLTKESKESMTMKELVLAGALVLANNTFAGDTETIGQWSINRGEGGSIASTTSDSGAIFGLICFDDTACAYFINPLLSCIKDINVPALAAGEAGALGLSGTCTPLGDNRFIYIFNESLDEMIAGSGTIGIAVALEDGQFKVFRFNMNGSIQTIAKIRSEQKKPAKPKSSAPSNKHTGDIIL